MCIRYLSILDIHPGSKFRRIVNQRHLERPLSHSFSRFSSCCVRSERVLHKNAAGHAPQSLRIEGRGLLANLRDKDNLSTADKTLAPQCVCCLEAPLYRESHSGNSGLMCLSYCSCTSGVVLLVARCMCAC